MAAMKNSEDKQARSHGHMNLRVRLAVTGIRLDSVTRNVVLYSNFPGTLPYGLT
jgi:hypothetical protein